MAKWWVSDIVRKRCSLNDVWVEPANSV